jgi:hypothetical protein
LPVVKSLLSQIQQRWLDGAQSISLPGQETLFPFWAAHFWNKIHLIAPIWDSWCQAVTWLQRKELIPFKAEVHATLLALSTLSWSGNIPCRSTAIPKVSLVVFLSRTWLSDEQIDQMIDILEHDIRTEWPGRDVRMVDSILSRAIMELYVKDSNGDVYDSEGSTFVHRFGQSLNRASEFAGMFHVNSNHWVACDVDLLGEKLSYGDPARQKPDCTVVSSLRWFVAKHLPGIPEDRMDDAILPCTLQDFSYDSWQCGLFGINGVGNHYVPDLHPLIPPDHCSGDLGRMVFLRCIITLYNEKVGYLDSQPKYN